MPQLLTRFRPGLRLTMFVVLLLPVLIRLGFWQLDREQEKLALQAVYEQRMSAGPRPLQAIPRQGDIQYMMVTVEGHYQHGRNFLLDNQTLAGRPGFDVITPFQSRSGIWVMVNRGWIPLGQTRQDLPEIPQPAGQVQIEGSVYQPAGEQVMLGQESPFTGWPRIIQRPDLARMEQELELNEGAVFPYTLRLAENTPGVLQQHWQAVSTMPEKHRGYAVQWFSMAVVLVLLFLYRGFKSGQPEQQDSAGGQDEER